MKTRSYKRLILLAFALLIGVPCVLCVMWVRKEQRQYALDRQLIAALEKSDTKQALVLVEEGADPNTRFNPMPPPSFNDVWKLREHPVSETGEFYSPNPTAIQMACGERWMQYIDSSIFSPSGQFHPRKEEAVQLVEVMLRHGGDPDQRGKAGTLMQSAQHEYHADLVALLRQYGKYP